MGGGLALALAPGHGFTAASTNYGALPAHAETILATACPIVASYGAQTGHCAAPRAGSTRS